MDDELRDVFTDVLGIDVAEYADDLSMDAVENWDSVMHLTLILAIEQRFGVMFPPEESQQLTSVAAIKSALTARQA